MIPRPAWAWLGGVVAGPIGTVMLLEHLSLRNPWLGILELVVALAAVGALAGWMAINRGVLQEHDARHGRAPSAGSDR